MISDTILTIMIGSSTTFLLLSVRYLFYSKCKRIKCCCFECIRDTVHELDDPEHNNNKNNETRITIASTTETK